MYSQEGLVCRGIQNSPCSSARPTAEDLRAGRTPAAHGLGRTKHVREASALRERRSLSGPSENYSGPEKLSFTASVAKEGLVQPAEEP